MYKTVALENVSTQILQLDCILIAISQVLNSLVKLSPIITTDFVFPNVLELFALVKWQVCFSVGLLVIFFSGDVS